MVALNPFNGGSVSRDLKLDGANYDGLLELEMLQIFLPQSKDSGVKNEWLRLALKIQLAIKLKYCTHYCSGHNYISQKPDLLRIKMSYFHNLKRKKNIESSQARDKVVFFV